MNYDRTRPLFDGRATIDGVDACFEGTPNRVRPTVHRFAAGAAYG